MAYNNHDMYPQRNSYTQKERLQLIRTWYPQVNPLLYNFEPSIRARHMAQIDLICITQSDASNQKIRWAKRVKEYYDLGKGVF